MAKSSLELRGAKASKLELDFFKLAFAVEKLRNSGDDAVGYLQVLSEPVNKRATGWIKKYKSGDSVKIILAEPSTDDFNRLIDEKAKNALALSLKGKLKESQKEMALGAFGEALGENALKEFINGKHKKAKPCKKHPFGIRWDYYGTVS